MNTRIPFHKIQGCGNDFIVCQLSHIPTGFLEDPQIIRSLCDRHYGIGSDGLMLLGPALNNTFDVWMYNPDGSEMGMCGNGIRCVVRFIHLLGLDAGNNTHTFKVFGRQIICHTHNHGQSVEVEMGVPSFEPSSIPVKAKLNQEIFIEDLSIKGWIVSLGNPHFVSFGDNLSDSYVTKLGPEIEKHKMFPSRINVGFTKIKDRQSIELKVWERGAGLTLACGTGACAAVSIGIKQGLLDYPCKVALPGGILEVSWESTKENASVILKGPATEVYSGQFSAADFSVGGIF